MIQLIKPIINRLIRGLILCLFIPSLWANELIQITNVTMPQIPPVSRTAAIYLTIENHSEKDITLTNVSTTVAHHAMLHLSQEVDGIAKMQHIDNLVIPAKGQVELSNLGYHIMLMGLDKNLINKPFEVQLEFDEQRIKVFIVDDQNRLVGK